jgi:hypothetical protein
VFDLERVGRHDLLGGLIHEYELAAYGSRASHSKTHTSATTRRREVMSPRMPGQRPVSPIRDHRIWISGTHRAWKARAATFEGSAIALSSDLRMQDLKLVAEHEQLDVFHVQAATATHERAEQSTRGELVHRHRVGLVKPV